MIEGFFKDIKLDKEFFIEAAKHVIAWNAKAHNGETPEFTQEMFLSQIEFVREELKEFQEAAAENNHVELLDAAADIFVVASYLSFMFFGEQKLTESLLNGVGDVFPINIRDEFDIMEATFTEPVQMAMMVAGITRMARDTLVRSVYNEKKVMKEVLKSNDSKYPTRKQILAVWGNTHIDLALAQECAAIEERNKDRKEGAYTGVTARYNEKQKVYVFTDDKGKIMKWSGFVKPNIASIVG